MLLNIGQIPPLLLILYNVITVETLQEHAAGSEELRWGPWFILAAQAGVTFSPRTTEIIHLILWMFI